MAKQIEGVYENVLKCAKQEFINVGFKNASLRTIAKNAGTSTGSIYTRFGDKEGIFREIVEPVLDGLKNHFLEVQETFHQLDEKSQKENMEEYTQNEQDKMFEYIYDNFDEFYLLLDSSYGTNYQNFIDDLVKIEVAYTYKYMEVINCKTVVNGDVTTEFMHIMMTAYFNGMFEIVRHNMKKSDARYYMQMLNKYHRAGINEVFFPE